jgi:hypothetical protein
MFKNTSPVVLLGTSESWKAQTGRLGGIQPDEPFCTLFVEQMRESITVCKSRRRNVVHRQSGVGWACYLLLGTGLSGPRPPLCTSGADLSKDAPGFPHPNDVSGCSKILLDRGHYRGKMDGVLGRRTRAGIRGYQKAENLKATASLIKRSPADWESDPTFKRRWATIARKPSLRQAQRWPKVRGAPVRHLMRQSEIDYSSKLTEDHVSIFAQTSSDLIC